MINTVNDSHNYAHLLALIDSQHATPEKEQVILQHKTELRSQLSSNVNADETVAIDRDNENVGSGSSSSK